MNEGITATRRGWRVWAMAALLAGATPVAMSGPAAGHGPRAGPAVADQPFPGLISLSVDATDIAHKVFRVKQRIPLLYAGSAGPAKSITLLYPQWQGASHAPSALVGRLAGLLVQAGGQRLSWRRDPVNLHAFHIQAPPGARELAIEFTYLSPRSGNVAMTRDIVNVGWSSMLLYPAGFAVDRLRVAAEVTLPAGMQYASSLPAASRQGDRVLFPPVSLETLVDSPLLAGRHMRQQALGEPGHPVQLQMFAARAEDLAATEPDIARHRDAIARVNALFGASTREPYVMMMVLDESMGGPGGVEHRFSSEVFLPAHYFLAPQDNVRNMDLMVHEYIHAWNGTRFMPAGMRTRTLNEPLQNSLLWVYEGLTQYFGKVIAARAGLRNPQQALDDLAIDAARVQAQAARSWKPLRDSVYDPITISGRGIEWPDFTGKKDYYVDGALLWLAVDVEIRARTGQRKSLDDFARLFFKSPRGQAEAIQTYTEADLYSALNKVALADWKRFFDDRLEALDPTLLLAGLERGGYRLTYTAEPTDSYRQDALDRGVDDYVFSAGFSVGKGGVLRALRWDGPAFRAGLSTGARLVRVNGLPYTPEALKDAVATGNALMLVFDADGDTKETRIDGLNGLRYPRLERTGSAEPLIDAILTGR